VRGSRHVAIEAVGEMGAAERGIVGLEQVVRSRLMRERRHGRVAIPGSRCRLVQAGVDGWWYASRWVPVFVVGMMRVGVGVGVRVVQVVLRLCVLVKVDLHDSGRFRGSALIAGPSARHGCPEVSRECANLINRPLL
jgi:anti-sigma factor RsiW